MTGTAGTGGMHSQKKCARHISAQKQPGNDTKIAHNAVNTVGNGTFFSKKPVRGLWHANCFNKKLTHVYGRPERTI
jgi:hypothetical protein